LFISLLIASMLKKSFTFKISIDLLSVYFSQKYTLCSILLLRNIRYVVAYFSEIYLILHWSILDWQKGIWHILVLDLLIKIYLKVQLSIFNLSCPNTFSPHIVLQYIQSFKLLALVVYFKSLLFLNVHWFIIQKSYWSNRCLRGMSIRIPLYLKLDEVFVQKNCFRQNDCTCFVLL